MRKYWKRCSLLANDNNNQRFRKFTVNQQSICHGVNLLRSGSGDAALFVVYQLGRFFFDRTDTTPRPRPLDHYKGVEYQGVEQPAVAARIADITHTQT